MNKKFVVPYNFARIKADMEPADSLVTCDDVDGIRTFNIFFQTHDQYQIYVSEKATGISFSTGDYVFLNHNDNIPRDPYKSELNHFMVTTSANHDPSLDFEIRLDLEMTYRKFGLRFNKTTVGVTETCSTQDIE